MGVYDNQQAVTADSFHCLFRFDELRRTFRFFHILNQLIRQTILLIYDNGNGLFHHINCSSQSAGRTNCIQIAKPMPHQENLICIFNQFLQCGCNRTNFCLRLLFYAFRRSAKKAKTIFCLNSCLVTAPSQRHIQRLMSKFFALFEGICSKSNANRKRNMNSAIDQNFSGIVQNLELFLHHHPQVTSFYHSIEHIIFNLPNNAICACHKRFQHLFHFRRNLCLFALLGILQNIIVTVNHQNQNTGLCTRKISLPLQQFGHIIKLKCVQCGGIFLSCTRHTMNLVTSILKFHDLILLLSSIGMQMQQALNQLFALSGIL